MDMLNRYKEAFSFRDEIGTCPNIEVETDVIAKTPFAQILDKERKRLCYLGILNVFGLLSPVMLTCKKLIKGKRCISDFRHKY